MKKSLLFSFVALFVAHQAYAGIMLGYTPEMCKVDVETTAGEDGKAYCFPLSPAGVTAIVGNAAWTNCALGTYNYGGPVGAMALFSNGYAVDVLLMDESGDFPMELLDSVARAFSPRMTWRMYESVQNLQGFVQWLSSGGTPVLQAIDMPMWDGQVCLQMVPVSCGEEVHLALVIWSPTCGVPGAAFAANVAAMMDSPELAAKVMGGKAPAAGSSGVPARSEVAVPHYGYPDAYNKDYKDGEDYDDADYDADADYDDEDDGAYNVDDLFGEPSNGLIGGPVVHKANGLI